MILAKPAPFVSTFIDAVDDAIRQDHPNQAMSAIQRTWLAFCVTAGIPVRRDISYHQSLSAIADWRLRARGNSSIWANTVSNRSGNSRRKNREAGVDPSEARQSKLRRALHT